jgi:hypothetical protein
MNITATHTIIETIRNIKKKLTENNLTLTKADKGKTTVILTLTEYEQKVNDFIKEHSNSNPTQKYQKRIKQILKQNKNITHMEIHKHEPNTPNPTCHNKTAQTRYTHQTHNQLEKYTSIRTSKTHCKTTT